MIQLIKSTFYNEVETKKKVAAFIKRSTKLSFGIYCQKFEKKFAKYQGRKYCIFVNSGSSANLALVQALLNLKKIKKGDKIGFSALTWSTNVMPLIQLGLEPVPIDIDLLTLNVSSKTLKQKLKKQRIKMLFLTNLLGFCSDLEEIQKICKKEKIILCEDNCEALGTVYKGRKLGNFGLASTFSFYVGHHMSTIEGGAVVTDNLELANQLRIVRAHGWDRNLTLRRQEKMRNKFRVNSTFYSRYTFYDLGFNLRPTEINGYIGYNQIQYINEIVKIRNKNFLDFAKKIYTLTDRYYPINYAHIDLVSNFAVPIICKTKEIRDELVEKCSKKVEIRPIVGGDIAAQPFFAKYFSISKEENPNASLVHEQGLYFGNNPDLTVKEKKEILNIFTK